MDISSQFPTILMIFNLCLSTFIKHSPCSIPELKNDPNVNEIQVNDSTYAEIKFVYVSKSLGIIPSITKELYREKCNCDEEKDKILEKEDANSIENQKKLAKLGTKWSATKILLNSIYGALGQPGSQLFEVAIALTITCMAWLAFNTMIDTAKNVGHTPVCGDTDSVFLCYQKQGGNMKLAKNKIEDVVNEVLGQSITPEIKMRLEVESIAAKFYVPKDIKKCYIKYQWTGKYDNYNLENKLKPIDAELITKNPIIFVENKRTDKKSGFKLCCKSFSWSLLPKTQWILFEACAYLILLTAPGSDGMPKVKEYCQFTIDYAFKMGEEIIQKWDYSALKHFSYKKSLIALP